MKQKSSQLTLLAISFFVSASFAFSVGQVSAQTSGATGAGSKCYDSFGTEVACTYDPATGASTSPVPTPTTTTAPSTTTAPVTTSNRTTTTTSGTSAGLYIPSGSEIGLSDVSVTQLIRNLMNWLLYIVGFVAIIAFVIAGLQYLLAGADSKMAEKAKESMQYAMVGVLVALSALIIIRAIQSVLSGAWFF